MYDINTGRLTYTNAYDAGDEFESSFVNAVLYDANDRHAAVQIGDAGDYYIYEGVSPQDVENLVNANSVGAAYNQIFKVEHGPAVVSMSFWDTDEDEVEIKNQAPVQPNGVVSNDWNSSRVNNDFTTVVVNVPADGRVARPSTDSRPEFPSDGANALTPEHSLAPIAVPASEPAEVEPPTTEHSLTLIETEVEDDDNESPTFVVHFKFNGQKSKYEVDFVNSWQEAVAIVRNVFAAGGVDVKVRKVVVKF